MDKFDLQIAMLRPKTNLAQLNERQFMKQLAQAHRAQLMRRALMGVMGLAIVTIIVGALRRNILDLASLTVRYFGDLPSMLTEYSGAYTATISWSSIASVLFLVALGFLMVRSRKDLTAAHSRRSYQYAAGMAVLALGLGVAGMVGGSAHANAQQEALRRTLNERGHLEVQVNGDDYELYAKSTASDKSIRAQAVIQRIRTFNLAKIHPEFQDTVEEGIVAEVRQVNTDNDCVYYVERRTGVAAQDKVGDADSGCIRHDMASYYFTQTLQPTSAPDWKQGQTFYMTHAYVKDSDKVGSIIFLLDGHADDYVAAQNSEQLVPKGYAGKTQKCGIHMQDICPVAEAGSFIVYERPMEMSKIKKGSSSPEQWSNNTSRVLLFGTILHADDKQLQLQTTSGSHVTITWSENYIQKFNAAKAAYPQHGHGLLRITEGDHLTVEVQYKEGADTTQFSILDVDTIDLPLKSAASDPLSGKTYTKQEFMEHLEKY